MFDYYQRDGGVTNENSGGAGRKGLNASTSRGGSHVMTVGSPAPMPQQHRLPPLSPMVPNSRRSNSRMSSSRCGLDDTPLGSPMPMYPRRRSVTFVDDEDRGVSGVREERPNYHTSTTVSASKAPNGEECVEQLYEDELNDPYAANQPPSIMVRGDQHHVSQQRAPSIFAGRSLPATPRKVLMTPTRRSASRQRLENRRHEAMMEHTFYDDSFVEDFVSTAKDELERKLQEERQAAAEARAEAERRAAEETARQRADRERQQAVAQISTISTISNNNQSNRSGNAPSANGEDSRAMLARLLKEFSALESSKPYIEMTPRKSQRGASQVHQETRAEREEGGGAAHAKRPTNNPRPEGRAASVMIRAPAVLSDDDDAAGAYDEEPEEVPIVHPNGGRATRQSAPAAVRGGHKAIKKTERIESLIREAMVNYRKNKNKAGSVMLIDLNDLEAGASESEAPTPEAPPVVNRRVASKSRQPARQAPSKATVRTIQLDEMEAPPLIQRSKRPRNEPVAKRAPSNRRLDSRPQFDDDSSDNQPDDQDDTFSDGGRPILLHRVSNNLNDAKSNRQSSRRIEANVESILSMGNTTTAGASKVLPRAPPPPRPPVRGRGARAKKDIQSEDEGLPAQRALPFAAPYVEPTLTRSYPTSRGAANLQPITTAVSRQKTQQALDPNDPFAHFFDLQFDSPAKFDEAPASNVGSKVSRRTNGGLMLAASCRTRRK